MPEPASLWAPSAWVDGRWQRDVLMHVDERGHWGRIEAAVSMLPFGCIPLPGPALPGLVNAHSHAFQRAFAGLAEQRDAEHDDFWSWRDLMYRVALRIMPEQLYAIAAQLDVELLKGGYTQVCEFHYLQHAENGSAYAEPATLAHALADAARDSGIGLTVLPVLYERAGFMHPLLRDDQRRFATTPELVRSLRQAVLQRRQPLLNAGVAIHSLRAASAASIASLIDPLQGEEVPIHIHVAEQTQEVDDCVQALGARPIEWLCRELRPDARWQLVHATHATPAEIDAVAASGAAIVVCPTTEANLGDGFLDLPRWFAAGVPIAIGSDSQVSRRWAEELRWLEYGQRLLHRRRNVAADPLGGQASTAARLFEAARAAGARACGHAAWGIVPGARADLLVLDETAIAGVPTPMALDAWIFAADAPAPREVWVAGRRVVSEGRHPRQAEIAARFVEVMHELRRD